MIIQYANGKTMEGVALSKKDNTMRVALRGHNDAVELFQVNGCWVTEDWEPVRIETGLNAHNFPMQSEAEFVCPQDLASRLIHLVRPETAFDQPAASWTADPWNAASPYPV
jgi:hypothetical protein